jgi:hypothetical protein
MARNDNFDNSITSLQAAEKYPASPLLGSYVRMKVTEKHRLASGGMTMLGRARDNYLVARCYATAREKIKNERFLAWTERASLFERSE